MWSSTTPNPCMFSFIWTTHWATNGSIFKIPSRNIYTIILFPTCSPIRYLRPIMPKGGGAWLIVRLIFPSFQLFSPSLFHSILYMTWTTPSLNCKHPSMCVHTSHWPYGYPPLLLCSWQRTHRNPWCNSNTFATTTWNVGFSMGQKQLHMLPSTTFNSFHQRVDIVFTKDGICTLANIVMLT
jgi:hypothetical protein